MKLPATVAHRLRRFLPRMGAVAVLGVGLASPARAETGCAPAAERMARVELFFGAGALPQQTMSRAFARFVAREVTPRFPDGLSLFAGYGQWRDSAGHIIREPTRLLLVYYRPDAAANGKIEAIRAAYKRRFRQQSVLRADTSACVSF